jgi:hypothetical protein
MRATDAVRRTLDVAFASAALLEVVMVRPPHASPQPLLASHGDTSPR